MLQAASRELDDWLTLNLDRGCTLDQLHESLLQAGYESTFAIDYLRQRSGGSESWRTSWRGFERSWRDATRRWGRCRRSTPPPF